MKEWRYSSTILALDTRWKYVLSFTSLPLYRHSCYYLKSSVVPSSKGNVKIKIEFLKPPVFIYEEMFAGSLDGWVKRQGRNINIQLPGD
jgi:hypothetical protein